MGRAAKLKRRGELGSRGIPDNMIDEFTAAIGQVGDIYYRDVKQREGVPTTSTPLPHSFAWKWCEVRRGARSYWHNITRVHVTASRIRRKAGKPRGRLPLPL